jgi:hypothetical protein
MLQAEFGCFVQLRDLIEEGDGSGAGLWMIPQSENTVTLYSSRGEIGLKASAPLSAYYLPSK